MPPEVYREFFSAVVADRVVASQVESIDTACLVKLIASIRTYKHIIPNLIDFRVNCLSGLSVSTRNNLTLGQVVQLYVCCFQHRSVREEAWRSVVNVWNHSVASACQDFIDANKFHVQSVVRMMVDAVAEQGPVKAEEAN